MGGMLGCGLLSQGAASRYSEAVASLVLYGSGCFGDGSWCAFVYYCNRLPACLQCRRCNAEDAMQRCKCRDGADGSARLARTSMRLHSRRTQHARAEHSKPTDHQQITTHNTHTHTGACILKALAAQAHRRAGHLSRLPRRPRVPRHEPADRQAGGARCVRDALLLVGGGALGGGVLLGMTLERRPR